MKWNSITVWSGRSTRTCCFACPLVLVGLLAVCLAIAPRAGAADRSIPAALAGGSSAPDGDAAADPVSDLQPDAGLGLAPAEVASACNYYDNRARFLPRRGRVGFIALLAEGCVAARRSLAEGGRAERAAAARFLDRIVRLRDVVIGINMSRVYGASFGPRSLPRTGNGHFVSLGGVSETGEYLIAHQLGLMQALENWRGRAPHFSLALR